MAFVQKMEVGWVHVDIFISLFYFYRMNQGGKGLMQAKLNYLSYYKKKQFIALVAKLKKCLDSLIKEPAAGRRERLCQRLQPRSTERAGAGPCCSLTFQWFSWPGAEKAREISPYFYFYSELLRSSFHSFSLLFGDISLIH